MFRVQTREKEVNGSVVLVVAREIVALIGFRFDSCTTLNGGLRDEDSHFKRHRH